MTILQAGKRRCDATCQCAKGRICTCVCFGVNHGRSWRDQYDDADEPVIARPRRLPRYKKKQLPLFESIPAY